jgi:hypothetical protein
MHRKADGVAFTLPGSNVRYKNAHDVKSGFRHAVFDQFADQRTNFDPHGPYRILDTLLLLGKNHPLVKCPTCGETLPVAVTFTAAQLTHVCNACHATMFATDTLRLHEQISDFGDNTSPMTRFMNVAEHLIVATLIRMLADQVPDKLAHMGFIIDGPLAIFGQPAWVHSPLMTLYHNINLRLAERGLDPPVVIGLQKEGQVMEHARAVQPHLPGNSFRPVDDDYREKWITGSQMQADNFGTETYYGQDFIFKTKHGGIFAVGLPYPFAAKVNKKAFSTEKTELRRYGDLVGRAFDLVRHFEFDLYENSVIPVALAHRHASISLVPGGKVLDIVSRAGLHL